MCHTFEKQKLLDTIEVMPFTTKAAQASAKGATSDKIWNGLRSDTDINFVLVDAIIINDCVGGIGGGLEETEQTRRRAS